MDAENVEGANEHLVKGPGTWRRTKNARVKYQNVERNLAGSHHQVVALETKDWMTM